MLYVINNLAKRTATPMNFKITAVPPAPPTDVNPPLTQMQITTLHTHEGLVPNLLIPLLKGPNPAIQRQAARGYVMLDTPLGPVSQVVYP